MLTDTKTEDDGGAPSIKEAAMLLVAFFADNLLVNLAANRFILPIFGFTTGFFLFSTTAALTGFLTTGFLITFFGTITVFLVFYLVEMAISEFSLTILRI